jgi:hypothetical protein
MRRLGKKSSVHDARRVATLARDAQGATSTLGKDVDKVDGFDASASPTAGLLLALDGNGDFPLSTIDDYDRGHILRGGASDWEAYDASPAGQILVGDGTDIASVGMSGDASLAADGAITLASGVAGDGLTGAGGDPLAVDESYGFIWTAEHTFEADIQLDADLDLVGAQSITTTADALTLAPAGDLLLDPAGNEVIFSNWGAGKALESDNYVSQATGWSIAYGSNGGDADFRYVYSDELHVQAFTADVYNAMAGALVITKSRATVSRDFTIPDTGNTATLYVEDLEGLPDTAAFTSGDYVLLKVIDHSGGGLVVTEVYGQVTSYSDLAGGEQSWTFTTTTTGYSSNNVIYAGSVVLCYGQTGSGSRGVWEATVLDAAGSPYSQVQTWSGVTDGEPSSFTTHVRVGNLDGISGVGLEYGLWAGQGTANDDPQILITDSSAQLRNLDLTVHDGSNAVAEIDYTTPYISVGGTAPSAFDTGDGWWVGNDGGTYKWRVGDVDGIRAQWNGADFAIYDSDDNVAFQVNSDGAWLSNLALSSTLSDQFFNANDGLLLLGPHCPIDANSWTSLRGQEAEITGPDAPHMVGGPWAGTRAPVFEQAAENLALNPIFGNGTTDWEAPGSNTIVTSTDVVFAGDNAGKATYQNRTTLCFIQSKSLDTNTYTVSGYVWVPSDWDGGDIYWEAGGFSGVSKTVEKSWSTGDPTGRWVRIITEFTPDAGDTSGGIWIYTDSAPTAGQYIYVDGAQLEQSDMATSLCYGDLDWCSWSGTAHNSTSTRSASHAEFDASILPSSGSLVINAKTPGDLNDGSQIAIRNQGNDLVFYNQPNGNFRAVVGGSARDFGYAAVPGEEIQVVITWDGSGGADCYIQGEYDGSLSGVGSVSNSGTVYLGYDGSGAEWNEAISQIAILDTILTAEEVVALYQRDAPLVDTGAHDAPGIYILDGRFSLATSTSGQRIEITAEEVAGYDSGGIKQFYLKSSDGKAYAANGDVVLSSDGVEITAATADGSDEERWVRWLDPSANFVGGIYGYDSTDHVLKIFADKADTSDEGAIVLYATQSPTGIGTVDGALVEIRQSQGVSISSVASGVADLRIEDGLYVGGVGTDPADGNIYVVNNVSAASFTDRTPDFKGNALEALQGIRGDGKGRIDHASLPEFARKTVHLKRDGEDVYEEGRDLGAMVSILTKGLQEVDERLERLERRLM